MRKWFIRVSWLLLLGGMTNAITAWAIAAYWQSTSRSFEVQTVHGAVSPYFDGLYFSLGAGITDAHGTIRKNSRIRQDRMSKYRLPYWILRDFRSWAKHTANMDDRANCHIRTAGFPLRCFTGFRVFKQNNARQGHYDGELDVWVHQVYSSGMVTIPSDSIPFLKSRRSNGWTFPCRPHLLAFAANTFVYGALWYLLIFAFGDLRSQIRNRRGHCPACGYNRTGLTTEPCPECGKHPVNPSHA